MSTNAFFDKMIWKTKAMAFVTRSHRHLWGKNNEDPQVFLYSQGLNNQFIKDMLLGWNKFGQKRPMEKWGFGPETQTLFLPSGIVVPFIVEKELKSVFICLYNENKTKKTVIIPGSSSPTLVLGEKKERIAVVQDLFDGLFLFQEAKELYGVIIHPDPDLPLETHSKSVLKQAGEVFVFYSDKPQRTTTQKLFCDVPDHCFYIYQTKQELKKLCLMH